MTNWECKQCGCCCEILSPLVLGELCSMFDEKTRKCTEYENRPDACRVQHQAGEETTEVYCDLLQRASGHLRSIRCTMN